MYDEGSTDKLPATATTVSMGILSTARTAILAAAAATIIFALYTLRPVEVAVIHFLTTSPILLVSNPSTARRVVAIWARRMPINTGE